jgi:hypothetical protein
MTPPADVLSFANGLALLLAIACPLMVVGEDGTASKCVDEALLFTVDSIAFSDSISNLTSEGLCPPVAVTIPPTPNTTNASTLTPTENATASPGTSMPASCARYDACVISTSVPTIEVGSVYVPPVLITGALSPYLEVRFIASLMALFSALWEVETVALGDFDASGYRCTLDVVWEAVPSADSSGQRFALILNAPRWSASLQNHFNGTIADYRRTFLQDRPREVYRAGKSLFDHQVCVLTFAAHMSSNISAMFQTLFGPPHITADLEAASAYVWSPGGFSTVQVSLEASVARVISPALEDGLVASLLAVNLLLLPVVPLLGGGISNVLLFASPYCTPDSGAVRSLERGRYRPLTELLGSGTSVGGESQPLTEDTVVSGVIYFCALFGLLLSRGVGSWLLHRVAPPTQSYDIATRLLLTAALLAPLATAVLLGALLQPPGLPGASPNTTVAPTDVESWASGGAWAWVYVLLIAAVLVGAAQLIVVFALAVRTRSLYRAIDEDVASAVTSTRFVGNDVPVGLIALVLAVVELEGIVQPTMVFLRPFASLLSPFRRRWTEWAAVSALLPWVHAFLLASPGVTCGVTEAVMAVFWGASLASFALTRPFWSSVEAVCFCINAVLMVIAFSVMAAYHQGSPRSHDLLVVGQVTIVIAACVSLAWSVFSGIVDGLFLVRRTLAIRSLWDSDEDLWWRACVRAPVASMLQQNATDDEDGADDDGAVDKREPHSTAGGELDARPPISMIFSRPLNLLTDNLEALTDEAFDDDDLILMSYVTVAASEATRGVRLPSGHQWAALRSVEVGRIDAQLMGEPQRSPSSTQRGSAVDVVTAEDDLDGDANDADDVVVDYADVEFLGGNINANEQLQELL